MAARRGQAPPPQLGRLERRLGAELVHPRPIAVGIVGESARQIGTEETNDFIYGEL